MKNGRIAAFSLLLTGLSIIFQTVPASLGGQFMPLTVLSALPIFLLTEFHLPLGFASYIIAGIGTAMANPYDAVLFWGLTGALGLSGSFFYRLTKNKTASALITACIISLGILTVNLLLSFYSATYSLPGQFLILLSILFPFCFAFICASVLVFQQLNRLIDLEPSE